MTEFSADVLGIAKLLLDPNNYRFQGQEDFVRAEEPRLHEQSVQDRAYRKLREEGLTQLKNSILTNGFVPVERLIVRRYEATEGLFVVVEGNRRLAALRWISEDDQAGCSVPQGVLDSLERVPVVVVEPAKGDPAFYEALMGIRHVSGIKEWGGYQRAKIVAVLRDTHGLEATEIADRLGMTVHEVNRRYRAFRALQQMKESEDFADFARSELYPVFHEAVSLPAVKEWLNWDESKAVFTGEENLEQFYDLITPNESDDAPSRDPKIPTYQQVRELRAVLPNTEARRVLLDPNRSFIDAIAIAKRHDSTQSWASHVAQAIEALRSMDVPLLKSLSQEDLNQIESLRDTAAGLLDDYKKLTS